MAVHVPADDERFLVLSAAVERFAQLVENDLPKLLETMEAELDILRPRFETNAASDAHFERVWDLADALRESARPRKVDGDDR
jgi:hypothetical protein